MKARLRAGTVGASVQPAPTRREIIESAKELIAVQGYSATTMRQIARKVSLKGGSLYYHFGGKEEILFSILDEGNRLLLDAAGQVLKLNLQTADAVLRRLVEEHIRILAEDPARFMVVTRELNRLKGQKRRRIIAQRDEYEQMIRGVLVQGIKEGSIRPCDVKIATYGVIALLNGVTAWYKPGGRLSIDRIVKEYAQLCLGGLRA